MQAWSKLNLSWRPLASFLSAILRDAQRVQLKQGWSSDQCNLSAEATSLIEATRLPTSSYFLGLSPCYSPRSTSLPVARFLAHHYIHSGREEARLTEQTTFVEIRASSIVFPLLCFSANSHDLGSMPLILTQSHVSHNCQSSQIGMT